MELLILILNIIGSIGLFLYGMKLMSEAMQRIAGGSLRRRLHRMTATPFSQVVTTGAITATVQSSSAVTAMIVSLVNASAITLREAIGMIFGANIGTTATAWVVAVFGFGLNLSVISVPLVGLGFSLRLIGRSCGYRTMGEIIIGMALLLLGISLIQSSMGGIAENTTLLHELAVYADLGYLSVVLFVIIGALLTALLQSSSATITLTIIMCQAGWLPIDAALGMIVGENIGTTLTANIAAIVAGSNAKRAALSHTVINILGMVWVVPLMLPIAHGFELMFADMNIAPQAAVPFTLALFHSGFNIVNTLVLIGFTSQIANFVCRVVPNSSGDGRKRLLALESGLVSTPELSIVQAHSEVCNHSRRLLKMFRLVRGMVDETDQERFESTFVRIDKYRQITDRVESEIISYLSRMNGREQSSATTQQIHSMLRTLLHLEQLSEANLEIARILQAKRKANQWFNQELRERLANIFDMTEQELYAMITMIEKPTPQAHEQCKELAYMVATTADAFRVQQIENPQNEQYKNIAQVPFSEIITQVERIGQIAERVVKLQQVA